MQGVVEKHRFRQIWLWALLLVVTAVILGPMSVGAYQQFVVGEPWGDRPLPDAVRIVMTLDGVGRLEQLFLVASA